MYQLYFKKEEGMLRVELMKGLMGNTDNITDIPTYFNDCYMVGSDRKTLKEKALDMQLAWIRETEEELERLKEIKIVSRYK